MQLAITVLGHNRNYFITEILSTIRDCKCSIVEIRFSRLEQTDAAYLLIQGNWNQIAKFESVMEAVEKRLEIKIHMLRPEREHKEKDFLPYSLETLSIDRDNIIESVSAFLTVRGIEVEEISGSSYQAPYISTSVFATKFIVLIPPEIRLLPLREEFLDFCDQLNIDAILEPIKR
ncbi:ACT domain-containing protein [Methylomicrobium sp. Wu6]|uniref:glycine cleavage system protein R n=1 Tax=Methylomicrobium sp. Wu6 TaxID=3107928 RepID=UPI002DD66FCC|nr:ACT domain-containing protein [Methylomicrobium sp. Wu6]MEC4749670.1 ACT domain-containing protein [Methylomicrobium sp. Wu6]